MTTLVRPATSADAERLSRFGAATFRETFGRDNSPEDMARYLAEAFTPERQAAEIADPAGTVLLAECAGSSSDAELVGYVHLVAVRCIDRRRSRGRCGGHPTQLRRGRTTGLQDDAGPASRASVQRVRTPAW